MASNPPFLMEDQTDEDFFDKLVNDDDDVDFKATASSATVVEPGFGDGNESDEAKAFANLSIDEVNGNENNAKDEAEAFAGFTTGEVNSNVYSANDNTGFDDLGGGKTGFETNGEVGGVADDELKEAGTVMGNAEKSSGSIVAGNSIALDSLVEASNNTSEASSDCTMISKSSGSGTSGIKEVEWSAFNADSAQDGKNGFGSYSDFFTGLEGNTVGPVGNVGENFNIESKVLSGNELYESGYGDSNSYSQYQDNYGYGAATGNIVAGQDVNSIDYWESQYPGWKYDSATGQWYQMDGCDANMQGNVESNSAADWSLSDGKSEASYLQQTAQSVTQTIAESGRTESVTNCNHFSEVSETPGAISNFNQVPQGTEDGGVASDWNQVSQVNNGYPSHVVFDPQYPGWYYDTIAQEWRSLDSYTTSAQSAVQTQDQLNQNGFAPSETYTHKDNQNVYGANGKVNNYTNSLGFSSHGKDYNWAGSSNSYDQQASSLWQPGSVAKSESPSEYSGNLQPGNHSVQNSSESNHFSQQKTSDYGGAGSYYGEGNKGQGDYSAMPRAGSFVSSGNLYQQFNQFRTEQIEQQHILNEYYGNQNPVSFSQQPFAAHQYSHAPTPERSSAGRPSHALVTFGFGGKLIVMKDSASNGNLSFGSQNSVGCTVSVLNLAEVVAERVDASSLQAGVCDYLHALCRQSFPGPLTGGSFSSKELNKWIDERIASLESSDIDFRKREVLRLLLSLLKIACKYYGKLRSPFGTETVSKESDLPESAIANLFASAKRSDAQYSQYDAVAHCLQSLPSEGQMLATAAEVQGLLVSGKKKEALLCAQEGQLWGPALVLAAQLGDQFYVDTVKEMALRQLVAGSPLRTLCLLIAGQPADVFSADMDAGGNTPGVMRNFQQPAQLRVNGMLDDWEENLAVIAANRTKDDELVLIHLGDCLWKERSDNIAAHICYLVAEANFEPHSDSARLCLVGADHWKFPRTYASPEAIQRTEIYEYSKVLGNSQFVLLPFQPYKLVYAHMLAEVGRMSDALKYCQAVVKSLKTGRSPEVETLRQLVMSLEERIKTHQQGGFSTNLASAKLVGKLLNLFDSTAHRVVGSMPPPVPSTSGGSGQANEHSHQSIGRVSTSQSTRAMSSLMPSASMEPISEWTADGSRKSMHNRSVSEPDFGRTPRQDQVDSSKDPNSASGLGKAASRLGRFGFGSQLLQKTVGLVLRPRQERQAKLGEKNKFYYDEKLKRWVEEGVEPPAEEVAPPPPPTTTAFQNGTSDYNLRTALKSEGSFSNGSPEYKGPAAMEHSSGMPPLPPTSNQFSARGRMGVRSRYVDTFNQGGGNQTNMFQPPSVPSVKPATGPNPKFFVPAPVSTVQPVDSAPDNVVGSSVTDGSPSGSTINNSIYLPASSSSGTMPRFASMDNISAKGAAVGNGSLSAHSRRTASWSGSLNDSFSSAERTEVKPLGEVVGVPPPSFIPSNPLLHSSVNGGSFGEDLHEVEL